MISCSFISSMICNIVKSCFFYHCFEVLDIHSLSWALFLGMCWSAVYVVPLHQYFWQGRWVHYALIDYGYETCCILLTITTISRIPLLVNFSVWAVFKGKSIALQGWMVYMKRRFESEWAVICDDMSDWQEVKNSACKWKYVSIVIWFEKAWWF